jgi:hypothetical protein
MSSEETSLKSGYFSCKGSNRELNPAPERFLIGRMQSLIDSCEKSKLSCSASSFYGKQFPHSIVTTIKCNRIEGI